MTVRIASSGFRIAAFVLATSPLVAQSQSTELHIKFKSGQQIVPIYEGWERVPDGTFNMVFGYLNRNHVEELAIPAKDRDLILGGYAGSVLGAG